MSSKAIDQKSLGPNDERILSNSEGTTKGRGINCTQLIEPLPNFIEAASEKVTKGKNNSYIVLGRDRPSTRSSGYGGLGDTQAGMIDIVVGRMGSDVRGINKNGEKIFTDSDFRKDAARIYISQKADIDDYFRISTDNSPDSQTMSAIGIKADDVRIIARQNIKLVTGTDPTNSRNGAVLSVGGIDLIAGNDDQDLQSIVKGDNLTEFLSELVTKISQLNGTLINFVNYQLQFNNATLQHYHYSPFFGIATSPDLDILPTAGLPQLIKMGNNTVSRLARHKVNLKTLGLNYLKRTGSKYINSRNNRTN